MGRNAVHHGKSFFLFRCFRYFNCQIAHVLDACDKERVVKVRRLHPRAFGPTSYLDVREKGRLQLALFILEPLRFLLLSLGGPILCVTLTSYFCFPLFPLSFLYFFGVFLVLGSTSYTYRAVGP